MTQQEVDPLKLSAPDVTEPGTGTAEIMRRQLGYSRPGRTLPHHTPDDLLGVTSLCAVNQNADGRLEVFARDRQRSVAQLADGTAWRVVGLVFPGRRHHR